MQTSTKYVFVTGGVVSGLGKGITAASLGRLLKGRGFRVTNQKFDPYINIDPSAMNPIEHGEVFVTEDGAQTDLDVGHYERFTDENLTIYSNITAGKIYRDVISREREGGYGGVTVQVIPHITNDIKARIYKAARSLGSDIVIVEVGGTVGDIESLPFIEAIRQVQHEVGTENVVYIHVPLVPCLARSGEMKTKPAQHSVKQLLSLGIQPHIIVCRAERHMPEDMRAKLALFCNVAPSCVIQNLDCDSLYEVPLMLEEEGLAQLVCEKLGLPQREARLEEWRAIVERAKAPLRRLNIALLGGNVQCRDAYLSIAEALRHSGAAAEAAVEIEWIDPGAPDALQRLAGVSGAVAHGGFDEVGSEAEAAGFLACLRYAREAGLPGLGINLGLHCMAVEYARNVAGINGATSAEFEAEAEHCVIEQAAQEHGKPAAASLGALPCRLMHGSIVALAYGEELVYERHRHMFEFNVEYRARLEAAGMMVSGSSPDEKRVEAVELLAQVHPFYVGVQFHPEYKSRPNRTHPLIDSFIKAALSKG